MNKRVADQLLRAAGRRLQRSQDFVNSEISSDIQKVLYDILKIIEKIESENVETEAGNG